MRHCFVASALLCALAPLPGFALSVDEVSVPSVTILTVEATDTPDVVRGLLDRLVGEGGRIALAGSPDVLARMRPSFVRVWPETNTILLDAATGLGIFGLNSEDDAARKAALSRWPWDDPLPAARRTPRAAAPRAAAPLAAAPREGRHVDFRVLATSPSSVCRSFSREMLRVLFDGRLPSSEERHDFRREVRRWCQYGTLSLHRAEAPQFTIEPFASSDVPRLTLATEWALIRREDQTQGGTASYLLWAKTLGDGAGTGFTRRDGFHAFLDTSRNELRYLMDVAIHSGWGSIEHRDVVTAWPLNSTFPATGDTHVFRCDAPRAFRPDDCPVSPVLRKLYPQDSSGGNVNVSFGESWAFGGEVKFSRSMDSEGKQGISMTFGFNLMRTEATSAGIDLPLVRVRSSAVNESYRSTWWTPDVPALFQWILARRYHGSLADVTALASTLNPRHEIVWEIPLTGNEGRQLPYHVVYEAGLNTCANGPACTSYQLSYDPTYRAKARVGWSDGMTVSLPYR